MPTPHLVSLGAQEMPRIHFEQILSKCHVLKDGRFNPGVFGKEPGDPLELLENR
jgi:Leu/Phe-tRNA-protein transferase